MYRTLFALLSLAFFCVARLVPAGDSNTTSTGYIQELNPETKPATAAAAPAPNKGGPTGSGIMYIRDKIPPVQYPKFSGRSYRAVIPDTLDLAERCSLAVSGLTSVVDPVCDYEAYCWVGTPAVGKMLLRHSYHDYNGSQQKWMENLPLLRSASGSMVNWGVDQRMMEIMYHMLGPDGLYYIPVVGSPWAPYVPKGDYYADPTAKQIVNSWPIGRALLALCCWQTRTPDEHMRQAITNMVDGLHKMAVYKDDYCYFLERKFDDRLPTQAMPITSGASISQSTIMCGLAQAYRVTGYEPAKTLGEKLAKFIMGPSQMFTPEGKFNNVHFHGATFALMGILDFGLATNDPAKIEFARKAYENAKTWGIPLVGWFPEGLPIGHPNVETCQISDMTIYAVKLARAGLGDYWEDVEHYTRNQLQSAQLIDTWWMDQFAEKITGGEPPKAPYENDENVSQRMIGTFSGMASVAGIFNPIASGCCSGNGPRALWFAWRHILEEKDGAVRVNLLLNRAAKAADVNSYLPYQGRVDVMMKKTAKLSIRIPSWVAESELRASVNGKPRRVTMQGRYADLGKVKKNQTAQVFFPLKRETVKIKPHDKEFTVDVKGYNVVDIWPRPAEILYPSYTRSDYRRETPRMVQVTRFEPDEEIDW